MIAQPPPEPEPSFIGLPSFLKLPYVTDLNELKRLRPDIAIVGAPFDMGTTIRPGARFGPRAIRQAAGYVGGSPVEPMYHVSMKVAPFKVLKVVDFGDANCPPHSIEQAHQAIHLKVSQVLEAGAFPFVLGGDHSITLPSASAVAEAWGRGKVGVIHFDSHADTAPDSFGGSLISHGSPMRRLIESGAVPGKNFVQIGLRGYWPPEEVWQWMAAQGMRWHLMAELEERGFDIVMDQAINEALDGPEHIYLSVDIDVLDPGFAPGTGTPEPGGMAPSQLLRAVRKIASRVHLVAMDLVEVSPPYDDAGAVTAEHAHRVVLEVITALAHKRAPGIVKLVDVLRDLGSPPEALRDSGHSLQQRARKLLRQRFGLVGRGRRLAWRSDDPALGTVRDVLKGLFRRRGRRRGRRRRR